MSRTAFLREVLERIPQTIFAKSHTQMVSVARQLLSTHYISEKGDKLLCRPTYGAGAVWIYEDKSGQWVKLMPEQIRKMVMRWDLAQVFVEENGESLKVNKKDAHAVHDLLLDFLLDQEEFPLEGSGSWLLSGDQGICFRDCFIGFEKDPDDISRVMMVTRPKSPYNRATSGFDFDAPELLDLEVDEKPGHPDTLEWDKKMMGWLEEEAPYFHGYLNTIWDQEDDAPERRRLICQWAGVALMGLAPRFNRALILHGRSGSGKSTFVDILSSLFPEEAISHVSPDKWDMDDRISAMVGARLNFRKEMPTKPLTNDAKLREIISGEPVQVRDPYVKAYSFEPRCAHLFACNKLPEIPGAHEATWKRFLVLTLNKEIRNSEADIPELSNLIKEREQKALIKWALQGADDAFFHNEYLIPPSSKRHMMKWQFHADNVALWAYAHLVDENDLVRPYTGTKRNAPLLSDVYDKYKEWCADSNHKPVTRTKFKERMETQGFQSCRSNGTRMLIDFDPFMEYEETNE